MMPVPVSDGYVPFARDFTGYATWERFEIHSGLAEGASHIAGDRTVFLNRRPMHGATAFPPGTLIVKATTDRVFAMAKRGGDYNADGAAGWEWLELEGSSEQPFIRWRGLGPPNGEAYGGPGNSGCNNCHTGAWQNDFVQAAALQLTGL